MKRMNVVEKEPLFSTSYTEMPFYLYLFCYKRIVFKHFTTSFYGPCVAHTNFEGSRAEMRTQAYRVPMCPKPCCYAVCISSSSSSSPWSQILNGLCSVCVCIYDNCILVWFSFFHSWYGMVSYLCAYFFLLHFNHAFSFFRVCLLWLFSLVYSRFHE